MHEFLMEYQTYFGRGPRFQVVAKDRAEALELGEKYIKETLHEHNAINGSLKVVRKLKPSFSKELA